MLIHLLNNIYIVGISCIFFLELKIVNWRINWMHDVGIEWISDAGKYKENTQVKVIRVATSRDEVSAAISSLLFNPRPLTLCTTHSNYIINFNFSIYSICPIYLIYSRWNFCCNFFTFVLPPPTQCRWCSLAKTDLTHSNYLIYVLSVSPIPSISSSYLRWSFWCNFLTFSLVQMV